MLIDLRLSRSMQSGLMLLMLILWLCAAEVAMSQETATESKTETPLDPALKELADEVARLELEKKRAEALQAIAVAKQAALAAELPSTEASGKEDKATVADGAGYFAELIAYGSLQANANQIGKEIASKVKDKTVILTEKADLSGEAALYDLVVLKISRFQDEFDQIVGDFNPDGSQRFAPGRLLARDETGDVTHDCTTLGGNSGSAVIDLRSGAAIGLHYGGYSDYNVAVPAVNIRQALEVL